MTPDVSIAYIIFQLIELGLLVTFVIWVGNLSWSLWYGAPFIRTAQKDVDHILAEISPVRGSTFLELGCGEGRVVCSAVKQYGVQGVGVDISPLWLMLARIRAWWMGVRVTYRQADILKTDLSEADTIYFFLLPRLIDSPAFQHKLLTEVRPGTQIISYGFAVDSLKSRKQQTIHTQAYTTYVYEL